MDLLENWYEEKSSVYLYNIIALKEKDPTRKELFHELAQLADKQASIWENELTQSGKSVPEKFQPNFRTLLVGKLIRYFGAQRLRFILAPMKVRGMSVYLKGDPNYPFSAAIVNHEHRHKGLNSAGNLRAAVFGINDGLISNVSLLLGIAGATSDQNFILLSGIAGMLAGACSMAAGEYVSVRSQREFFEYQIELERNELKLYPEEEASELAAIYHARGLPKADAVKLSKIVISDPEKALDTLAREELGLNPSELGSPWGAAISSFVSFSIGALIPVIPFIFGIYRWNLLIAVCLAGVSLFTVGGLLSLFTNRSALMSGLRMFCIGMAACGLTYFVGSLIGVSIH